MKLRTEIVQVDGETHLTLGVSPGRYTAKEHDAMAAHALLQALRNEAPGVHGRVTERAAEILAGWLGEDERCSGQEMPT